MIGWNLQVSNNRKSGPEIKSEWETERRLHPGEQIIRSRE